MVADARVGRSPHRLSTGLGTFPPPSAEKAEPNRLKRSLAVSRIALGVLFGAASVQHVAASP
jgi:hypothetical protein